MVSELILHIPEGINFDCTGCGNCCFMWPVPLTDADVKRISSLPFADQKFEPVHILSTGVAGTAKEMSFSAALGKRKDGKCQYLSPDNQCEIHLQFGRQSKPSMCQLFPYTFTSTPAGVFVSASFASTGVLYNQGRPLAEQREHLQETYELFSRLFAELKPDWSHLQLVDGQPISFEEYLALESEYLEALLSRASERADKILVGLSKRTLGLIAHKRDFDRIPGVDLKPRIIDSLLIKSLMDTYFPSDVYRESICDIDSASLARSFVMPPDKVHLEFASKQISFSQLTQYSLGALSDESESLLRRFAYLKIFSKLYVGAGFAGLSLLAGLNHLAAIIALVRIHLKLKNIDSMKNGREITFEETAESVRTLERRLTAANFSNQSKTILEVLLTAPERAERISSLAS